MGIRDDVGRAVGETDMLDAMRRSFDTILERQRSNAGRMPGLEARKERARRVKEDSVGSEQLLAQAVDRLRENGCRVLLAKDGSAAVRAVLDELGDADLVVKSKSNITKEMHLADRLDESGIQVVETDLGDRIVQIAGCAPVHPTGPACHMSRGRIAELLSSHFGREISDAPDALTAAVRDELVGCLERARVGITGANAVAACEGAVVIVHNEGNAALCSMRPDKHIVITTPEKVVPTLDDALDVVKLQTYFSTGKVTSAYVNIISGPSYTADIEKRIFRGMHGPKEVVVVMVDDGRLSASDPEPLYCIGCGSCLTRCPVYRVVGPVFGTAGHLGGQGVYLESSLGRSEGASDAGLYLCTSCDACRTGCPMEIDTRKGIMKAREKNIDAEGGIEPEHRQLLASVRNYDNPWQLPRSRRARWAKDLGTRRRGEVLYFAGCSTSLLFPGTARCAVEVLRSVGVEPAYLGAAEKCCGSTARKLGDARLSRTKVEACFDDFAGAGARTVVVSCPGCLSALTRHGDLIEKHDIRVQHISQFVDGRFGNADLRRVADLGKVTYHDPCDLGREQGVYDEPRRLLEAAVASETVEMELSREDSACCGSGSGVRSAYGALAEAVGLARVDMAVAAGAETMVTSCPWCVQNLRECQAGEARVRVVDLVEVLARAAGVVPSEDESPPDG